MKQGISVLRDQAHCNETKKEMKCNEPGVCVYRVMYVHMCVHVCVFWVMCV